MIYKFEAIIEISPIQLFKLLHYLHHLSISLERMKLICLIPQVIAQDTYIRMTRDVCYKLEVPKSGCLLSQFL
ncbi:unnamed protein product [Paramecium octaurelia]|uniref:Uncharacterized protein n=1 Tax=Paramecium octaurelia TaxID=43137 RepID=A0A8S1SKU3_PAROT|nr:unnamed protein product [Paramecium octaurelia]